MRTRFPTLLCLAPHRTASRQAPRKGDVPSSAPDVAFELWPRQTPGQTLGEPAS